MQKDKVILYVIVALLVGFIAGAITGIVYTTREGSMPAAGGPPQTAALSGGSETEAEPPSKMVSSEEIALHEDAVKADPNNVGALIALGNLYFDGNQPRKAIDAYQRALKIDPKNADVRTDMAIMHRKLGEFDKAVQELRQAAEANPKHVNSRYNLGIVLLHDTKDFPGAIAAWEEVLKIEPTGERANMIRQRLKQLRELKG